jgi:hypothetical protein
MTYYKDTTNNLYFLSSEDIANGGLKLIPAGVVTITDTEAFAIQNPYSSLQATQVALVTKAYNTEISSDITFTTSAGITKDFQADTLAISNIQSVLLGAGGILPFGFYWVAADNTHITFTIADLQGLANAIFLRANTAFQHLQTLKAEIAVSSLEGLAAIIW